MRVKNASSFIYFDQIDAQKWSGMRVNTKTNQNEINGYKHRITCDKEMPNYNRVTNIVV